MLALTLLLAAASAQPACAGQPAAPLPQALSGWSNARPAKELAELGKAFSLELSEMPSPAKNGRTGYQGRIGFQTTSAGRYAVAADDKVWIDVLVEGSKLVKSATHQPGPQCSGIRKIVMFDLEPGRHEIHFEGNPTQRVQALVTPWP